MRALPIILVLALTGCAQQETSANDFKGDEKAVAEAGMVERLASPHDAFAIVGAIVELASRQLRTKEPEDIRELEPVIGRLVLGLVGAAPPRATAA